jgi:hypothetical protein
VTSVRDTTPAIPAPTAERPGNAAGPRCHCGTAITRTPGKRTRIYCSEACKKRAQRAIAAGSALPAARVEAAPAQPKRDTGFSSNGKIPSAPSDLGVSTSRPKQAKPRPTGRDARFERRDAHQTVALGKAFRGCGTKLAKGDARVMLDAATKSGSLAGVRLCHSVNLCPWCMAKVLVVRAVNIQAAADGLAAAGYVLALGTHTLRHFERMAYGSLRDGMRGGLVAVLHDGWKGAYGSAGRAWRRLSAEFGIVGYERAFEDTWGSDTGYHLHWHVLWVLKKPLDSTTGLPLHGEELEEFYARFRRRLAETWREAVLAAGGYDISTTCDRDGCSCGGEGHGSDLRIIGADEEGETARYLYKDGDKGTGTIGLELTGGEFKDARRWGRMSPLQLGDLAAEELAETGEPGPLTARYREREFGVFKVRKLYRTQGLNKLIRSLGIEQDTRTDGEITEAEGTAPVVVAVIPPRTWYRHVAYVPGRRLALIRAVESLGEIGVRILTESWGLEWGTDVLPAPNEPGPADPPTPEAEVPAPEDRARAASSPLSTR